MKYFFNIFALLVLSTSLFAQKTLSVSVQSDCVDEKYCHTIEDLFHENLLDAYIVRTFSDKGEFAKARMKELAFQESGNIPYEDIKSTQKMFAADELMVVVVERLTNGEYYFRAKLFDLETGQLKKTAIYPNISDDSVYEIHNTITLQMVSSHLIARLGINIDDMQEQAKKAYREAVWKPNGIALAYSLIPGVGLMMKGHKAEGAVYMVGDIALIGGGLAFMANANKQKDIMNNYSTGIDQYKSAEKKYNSSKTAAYCCFGAAAALYVVNLVRGYVAERKPGSRLQWAVVPSVAPTMYGEPKMSVNLALSYKF